MALKKWIIPEMDKAKANELAEECDVEPFLALMAYSRGYTEPFSLDMFLSREVPDLDPYMLLDMEPAVERINRAVGQGEKIVIYGDYDCDGVASTALLYRFFTSIDANVSFYIPNRHSDGYGMNMKAVETLAAEGTALIITVDNGINACREVARAGELGMDVIVTDHHLQTGELPNAVAVINPHRRDSVLDFQDFAGVGVAFFLALAVSETAPEVFLSEYSDLVALGTVADVMPLAYENRSLVWLGLKKINRNPSTGIKALLAASGAHLGSVTAGTLAFSAAPRINAAGRLGDASRAVRLLTETNYAAAMELAAELDDENQRRQAIEKQICDAAAEQVLNNRLYQNRVIVAAGENWHEGVLGIAAARLAERFGRPVILFGIDPQTGTAKGSARTVGEFSIFEAIDACGELLVQYGGHDKAAGLSIMTDRLAEFDRAINTFAKTREFPISSLFIDCRLNPAAVTPDLVYALSPLEPYGVGNPKPVFGLFSMRLSKIIPVGNGRHLRLIASKKDTTVAMLLFGVTPDEFPFAEGSLLDFAVTLEMRSYQGEDQLSVTVKDVRKAGQDEDEPLRSLMLYEAFEQGGLTADDARALCFDRAELAVVYRAVRGGADSIAKLSACLDGFSYAKLNVMVDVMEELGLVTTDDVQEKRKIRVADTAKVELENSNIYCNLKSMAGENA